MNLQARIDSLKARHEALEAQIFEEDHRPRPDDAELVRLRRAKLRLKDELERLRTRN